MSKVIIEKTQRISSKITNLFDFLIRVATSIVKQEK